MSFDFYVGNVQYTVEKRVIRKNGEVLFEGDLHLYNLLLGMPGLILIHEDEESSPKLFKTAPITSILPKQEYVNGKHEYVRSLFLIKWRDQHTKRTSQFRCHAVSEEHAIHLLELYEPSIRTKEMSVSKLDMVQQQA